jgi:N-acetylmuramic acid 6-phosphate (MurNAc-6-P) etherase
MDKESKIAFVSNDDLEERIQIVMRQTDYTKEMARDKLTACNYDSIKCIREYMGITEKKAPANVSVNQQIYRELRTKMGAVALPDPSA